MKCLVCGKTYQGAGCPRCDFPNVQVPGNLEAALEALRPSIEAYRKDFLSKIQAGVVAYYWKDQEGLLVVDHQERCPFGNGLELYGKEVWIPRKFARIPEEKELRIQVYFCLGDKEQLETVSMPNLLEPQLQQIGIQLDEDLNACLMLRNETGTSTRSEKIPLFP